MANKGALMPENTMILFSIYKPIHAFNAQQDHL